MCRGSRGAAPPRAWEALDHGGGFRSVGQRPLDAFAERQDGRVRLKTRGILTAGVRGMVLQIGGAPQQQALRAYVAGFEKGPAPTHPPGDVQVIFGGAEGLGDNYLQPRRPRLRRTFKVVCHALRAGRSCVM